MKHLSPAELKEVALDIEVELEHLARLRDEIEHVTQLIGTSARKFVVWLRSAAEQLDQ